VNERLEKLGLADSHTRRIRSPSGMPSVRLGHPVRATISDMGPLLLGRMLELNETQAGVLNLVFKVADDATACCCWI
jgi:DNA helicase HerA-like ATPase